MKYLLHKLKKFKNVNSFIHYYEPIFFIFLLIIICIPLFQHVFIYTLDGPAHGYNAKIIKSLLFEDKSYYANYYQYNPELIPNWSGHFILALLNIFFSMGISEKILQFLIIVGLPIAFRQLLKTIAPQNVIMSYLVFPFSYSFVFFLGFYNFSIALILMFVILNYLIRNYDKIRRFKHTLVLSSLFLATYFSHALIFLCTVMLFGLFILLDTKETMLNSKIRFRARLAEFSKYFFWFVIIVALPVSFFISFQMNRIGNPNNHFLSSQELLKWIVEFRPLIVYYYDVEKSYSQVLFLITAIIVFISLAVYFYRVVKKIDKLKVDFWFIAFIIFLLLLFILPDDTSTGGVISVRILLIALLLLILALSRVRISTIIILPLILFYLLISLKLINSRKEVMKNLSQEAVSMKTIGKKIKDNSSVAFFNFSGNWLLRHYSNYIGYDRKVLLLENYEVDQLNFPLKIIDQKFPDFRLGEMRSIKYDPLINWNFGNNQILQIKYVVVRGNLDNQLDSNYLPIIDAIQKHYKQIHKIGDLYLFELEK